MKLFYLFMLFGLFVFSPSCLLAVEIQSSDWPNTCAGSGGGPPCQGAPQLDTILKSNGDVCLTGGIPPYYGWGGNNTWVGPIGECDLPADPVDCPSTATYNDSCGIIDNTNGEGLVYSPPVNSHAPLTISGPDAPIVGEYYIGSGGVPPLDFSISCGSIDSTGKITSLSGCCGSGTVEVVDDCGGKAQKAVRFPSGRWVLQSTTWENGSGTEPPCGGYYEWQYSYDETSGNVKTEKQYCTVAYDSPYSYYCSENEDFNVCCTVCTLYSLDSHFDDDYFQTYIWLRGYLRWTKAYVWQCL